MKLEKIQINEFDKMFAIMDESFPADEHRPYEGQKALLEEPAYSIYGAMDEETGEMKGFLAVWEFEQVMYVEHFAVNPAYRNGGLGSRLIRQLDALNDKMICLEVEPPEGEMAVRRIEFYKRNNFFFNEYEYIQPALGEGLHAIPLFIMTSGRAVNREEFESIKTLLYTNVFKMKEVN